MNARGTIVHGSELTRERTMRLPRATARGNDTGQQRAVALARMRFRSRGDTFWMTGRFRVQAKLGGRGPVQVPGAFRAHRVRCAGIRGKQSTVPYTARSFRQSGNQAIRHLIIKRCHIECGQSGRQPQNTLRGHSGNKHWQQPLAKTRGKKSRGTSTRNRHEKVAQR